MDAIRTEFPIRRLVFFNVQLPCLARPVGLTLAEFLIGAESLSLQTLDWIVIPVFPSLENKANTIAFLKNLG